MPQLWQIKTKTKNGAKLLYFENKCLFGLCWPKVNAVYPKLISIPWVELKQIGSEVN